MQNLIRKPSEARALLWHKNLAEVQEFLGFTLDIPRAVGSTFEDWERAVERVGIPYSINSVDFRAFPGQYLVIESGVLTAMNEDQLTKTFSEVGADSPAPAPGTLLFKKRPVTISAIKWTGDNLRDVVTFMDGAVPDTAHPKASDAWETYSQMVARDGLHIITLEGKMVAAVGDYVIRGVKGEFYPCKPDIFDMTYEPAADDPEALAFSPILEGLKGGRSAMRSGWNGSGMRVFYVAARQAPDGRTYNGAYFIEKDGVISSWVPSSTDLSAVDWRFCD